MYGDGHAHVQQQLQHVLQHGLGLQLLCSGVQTHLGSRPQGELDLSQLLGQEHQVLLQHHLQVSLCNAVSSVKKNVKNPERR